MNEPIISVGIISNRDVISVKFHGIFIFNNEKEIKNQQVNIIIKDDKICLVLDAQEFEGFESLYFKAKDIDKCKFEVENVLIGIDFHWEQAEEEVFQGSCKIILKNNKLTLINEIPIEKYLESVISSEMNAESPYEYLKAHCIIARSWLLAQLEIAKNKKNSPNVIHQEKVDERIKWYDREDHEDFDVCADDHCQRYHGLKKITDNKSVKAVRETYGLVLSYDGKICDTRYSKCCGGVTEEFQNVWQDEYFPYLKSVYDNQNHSHIEVNNENDAEKFILNKYDDYCNTKDPEILNKILVNFDQLTTDFYRWEIRIKQLALVTLLKLKLKIDFGEIIDLVPLERGKSGRIIKLKIVGTKKVLTIGKELEIRRALSEKHLYSSAFLVEKIFNGSNIPSEFILKGAGWGHGVGFCQIGGGVMAAKGKKYDEILFHYFTDSKLEKLY